MLSFGKKRAQKAFRKTVRTSSATSYGSAIGSVAPIAEKGIKSKAKGYSVSLKNKLKNVFSRGSGPSKGLPSQQVEADRPHFNDYIAGPNMLEYTEPTIPMPDKNLLHRVNSRGTSPHRMPVHLPQPSRAGSIRSVLSNDDLSNGKSRVTSWTDSTVSSSLTREQLLERKRLSIIQENGGPHQPSSSFGTAPRRGFFGQALHGSVKNRRDSTTISNRQIFSALQQRLDQHNDKHEHDEYFINGDYTERGATAGFLPSNLGAISERSSTIRMLPDSSGYDNASGRRIRYSSSASFQTASFVASEEPPRLQKDHRMTYEARGPHRKLSFKDIADLNEREETRKKQAKQLREVKSAFFPPSSEYQTRRSVSPYRQALRSANMERELSRVQEEHQEEGPPKFKLPLYSTKHNQSSVGTHSAYSRTTGGNSGFESTFSLDHSQSTGEPGTAFIITKSPNRPTTPQVPRATTSSQSSGEMRGWMASEVAKLEKFSSENIKIHEDYLPRESRHHKESAQTHNDETDDAIQEELYKISMELSHGKQNSSLSRPILRHKTSDQMIEKFPLRFPLIERNNLSTSITTERRASLSSQKPGAVRRYTSNLENQKFPAYALQRHPAVRRQTSAASMASQDSYAASVIIKSVPKGKSLRQDLYGTEVTPTPKSNSSGQNRCSPERAARLRRMRSSVGVIDSKENAGSKETLVSPKVENSCYGYEAAKGTITGMSLSPSPLNARNVDTNQPCSPGGSQVMVNRFLTTRMQNSPISGGRGTSPAFI